MTSQPHSRAHLSRLAIAGAFLLTGLAGTVHAASASGPTVDTGGSGDVGDVADRPIFLEEFGLVPTNGGPGSFTMHPELDGPTLVGSGPEREIVSHTDHEAAVAEAQLDGPTLVGSGPEREIVAASDQQDTAGTLDETTRANDLIALSPTGNETAAVHRGQPY